MANAPSTYPHFRLNLEQQKKRAKDLLKAARADDANAVVRFGSVPKLSEAQFLIARELRFDSWAELKRHIAKMASEREAMTSASASERGPSAKIDGELRTLHIRCGSDIKIPLQTAGFGGEFYEHSYPYLIGPVREGPGSREQRARFLVETHGDSHTPQLAYERVLERLTVEQRGLDDSADYDRVVIWSEFDCYDQLVLVRLLGHYARHRRPPRLELVNVGGFPGAVRFLGLGQLPPEALRLLWATRVPVTPAILNLGLDAWLALANPDPRALGTIMRSGTPALPLLATALHRHLRELPSTINGLSFTEQMALELLAERPQTLSEVFSKLKLIDPLPGQGDVQVRDRVLGMESATRRVFTRQPGAGRNAAARSPWTDVLAITELGRAVLRGAVDFRTLQPAARWVGGVEVGAGNSDWRWDEEQRSATQRWSLR